MSALQIRFARSSSSAKASITATLDMSVTIAFTCQQRSLWLPHSLSHFVLFCGPHHTGDQPGRGMSWWENFDETLHGYWFNLAYQFLFVWEEKLMHIKIQLYWMLMMKSIYDQIWSWIENKCLGWIVMKWLQFPISPSESPVSCVQNKLTYESEFVWWIAQSPIKFVLYFTTFAWKVTYANVIIIVFKNLTLI